MKNTNDDFLPIGFCYSVHTMTLSQLTSSTIIRPSFCVAAATFAYHIVKMPTSSLSTQDASGVILVGRKNDNFILLKTVLY